MPDQKKDTLVEITIPADPEYLRVVRLLVSGYSSNHPLPLDEVEDIKVAVSEACNNAIQKAESTGAVGSVKISCWIEGTYIFFKVEDSVQEASGDGFDENADAERGLGFLLIQTLMDEVDVSSTPEHGTLILMKKKIDAA